MTREQLAAIEARHQKATPGPWTTEVEEYECGSGTIAINEINRILHDQEWADPEDWDRDLANAGFIAHARTDVPALLAENARLADEAARLRAALDGLWQACKAHDLRFNSGFISHGQAMIVASEALASPASESVARRAAERELTEAARELADLAATWFPTANECVAYRSLRAKLAAKEGA